MKNCLLFFGFLLFYGCKTNQVISDSTNSDLFKVEALSENLFVHVSYLATESWGNVPCNGMIFRDGKEAIVFDTPTSDSASYALLNWIEKELKCEVKAVVVNHFHVDCLGGLEAFHESGIKSYASKATIDLAKAKGQYNPPQIGFDEPARPNSQAGGSQSIKIGTKEVINQHFGAGHTSDNIVSYVPSEKALFGGCMIKSMGAGKGNLADANVAQWPKSVENVKRQFPDLKWVVPGHGKVGGTELLNYTIELFGEPQLGN